jgi:glycosyltransferase involved in cell wall biosynthesis
VIKVAAFTTGEHIPGSRFRVRQYVQALRAYGIELSEFFTKLGAYPPTGKLIRPFWAVGSLASRLPSIVHSYRYDVILFQREMLSTFFTLEPFTKKPRILDVDDAIWLYRNGSCARRLAKISDSVICGNSFLADYFSQWNPKIAILPTAVDTDRFLPLASKPFDDGAPDIRPIIGWSGGHGGFVDLQVAEQALQGVLRKYPRARLRVIADAPPRLDLPAGQCEFVPWSPETEVQAIQGLDIGIMPLRDTLWNRGKCAYKMLLYMSCGIPVVVSPIGMTAEVCQIAPVGACARTTEDWVGALEQLLCNRQLAADMGRRAREVVLQNFSVRILGPKLAAELLRVAGREAGIAGDNRCLASSNKEKD